MRPKKSPEPDTMRSEYTFDYSKGVRGKYSRRIQQEGSNIVVLEPDVAQAFRGSAAVNDALRSLLRVAKATQRPRIRRDRAVRKQPID